MTAVVGLVSSNKDVWLAADSALTDDEGAATVSKSSKVFRIGAEIGIAYAGSVRAGQLFQHNLKAPSSKIPKEDVAHWMCTKFVDSMKDCLREGGLLQAKDGVDSIGEGSMALIGIRGHLFAMYDDFQITEARLPFAAGGAGRDLVLGALYSTYKTKLQPKSKIVAALRAAEAFNVFVRKPFRVICISNRKSVVNTGQP